MEILSIMAVGLFIVGGASLFALIYTVLGHVYGVIPMDVAERSTKRLFTILITSVAISWGCSNFSEFISNVIWFSIISGLAVLLWKLVSK